MQNFDGVRRGRRIIASTAHAIVARTTSVSILRSLAGIISRVAEKLRCLNLERLGDLRLALSEVLG